MTASAQPQYPFAVTQGAPQPQYPFAVTQDAPQPGTALAPIPQAAPAVVVTPDVSPVAHPYPFNTSVARRVPTQFVENGSLVMPSDIRTARKYPMPVIPSRFDPSFGRYGHYRLPDVEGERSEAYYPRVTTISKALDDTTFLDKWSTSKMIEGLARYPQLLNMVDVNAAAEGDRTTREFLESLAEVAKEAAGAKDASEFGNAVHAWTEAVDLGLCTVDDVPLELRAHVAAYINACRAAGIVAIPAYIERIVYNDVTGAAGRIDRISMLPDGTLVILDVKTTSNLSHGLLSIGVQLAQYATGKCLLSEDGQSWEPMPANLSRTLAIVAHVPSTPDPKAGGVFCDLVDIDLEQGVRTMYLSREVRSARSAKRYTSLGTRLRAMSTDKTLPLINVPQNQAVPNITSLPQATATPALPSGDAGVVSVHAPSAAPDEDASVSDRVFRETQDALTAEDMSRIYEKYASEWEAEFTDWGMYRLRQLGVVSE